MSIVFVAKVHEKRSSNEALVEPIRVVSQIELNLPRFHTRAQKRYFKQKLKTLQLSSHVSWILSIRS